MSTVVLIQEIKSFKKNRQFYGLPVIEDTGASIELLRVLKKAKKKRGSGSGYGDFDPAEYYSYDTWV